MGARQHLGMWRWRWRFNCLLAHTSKALAMIKYHPLVVGSMSKALAMIKNQVMYLEITYVLHSALKSAFGPRGSIAVSELRVALDGWGYFYSTWAFHFFFDLFAVICFCFHVFEGSHTNGSSGPMQALLLKLRAPCLGLSSQP
jgi:hypothetical protein